MWGTLSPAMHAPAATGPQRRGKGRAPQGPSKDKLDRCKRKGRENSLPLPFFPSQFPPPFDLTANVKKSLSQTLGAMQAVEPHPNDSRYPRALLPFRALRRISLYSLGPTLIDAVRLRLPHPAHALFHLTLALAPSFARHARALCGRLFPKICKGFTPRQPLCFALQWRKADKPFSGFERSVNA